MTIELPGLFDLQVNGFGGVDFNGSSLSADRCAEALERMRATGVTRCLPTLITSPFDRFAANARVLARMTDPSIAGLHMEGPYLSPDDGARGAHPREHVTAASIDDFNRRQEAADGRILLVTLAPEVPGAIALIEHLVASRVRVAIGHTAASAAQVHEAIVAGATLATHLGNGCAAMLPRHPNIIWDLLADDAVMASVIVDGHHLPPSLQTADASGTVTRVSLKDAVAAYERDLIQDALKTTRGNRAKAARLLDTTERILNYKVRGYGIDSRRFKSPELGKRVAVPSEV